MERHSFFNYIIAKILKHLTPSQIIRLENHFTSGSSTFKIANSEIFSLFINFADKSGSKFRLGYANSKITAIEPFLSEYISNGETSTLMIHNFKPSGHYDFKAPFSVAQLLVLIYPLIEQQAIWTSVFHKIATNYKHISEYNNFPLKFYETESNYNSFFLNFNELISDSSLVTVSYSTVNILPTGPGSHGGWFDITIHSRGLTYHNSVYSESREEYGNIKDSLPVVRGAIHLYPDEVPLQYPIASNPLNSFGGHLERAGIPKRNFYINPMNGNHDDYTRNDLNFPTKWTKGGIVTHNMLLGEVMEVRNVISIGYIIKKMKCAFGDSFMGDYTYAIVPDKTYSTAFFQIQKAYDENPNLPRIHGFKIPILEFSDFALLVKVTSTRGIILNGDPVMQACADRLELIANMHLIVSQNPSLGVPISRARLLQKHHMFTTASSTGPESYLSGDQYITLTKTWVIVNADGNYTVKLKVGQVKTFTVNYDVYMASVSDPNRFDLWMPFKIVNGKYETTNLMTGHVHAGRVIRIIPFMLAYNKYGAGTLKGIRFSYLADYLGTMDELNQYIANAKLDPILKDYFK
ncbi:MAG: hypothetical protein ACTSRK_17295 [Promethearchaeota archaeon]